MLMFWPGFGLSNSKLEPSFKVLSLANIAAQCVGSLSSSQNIVNTPQATIFAGWIGKSLPEPKNSTSSNMSKRQILHALCWWIAVNRCLLVLCLGRKLSPESVLNLITLQSLQAFLRTFCNTMEMPSGFIPLTIKC